MRKKKEEKKRKSSARPYQTQNRCSDFRGFMSSPLLLLFISLASLYPSTVVDRVLGLVRLTGSGPMRPCGCVSCQNVSFSLITKSKLEFQLQSASVSYVCDFATYSIRVVSRSSIGVKLNMAGKW